MKRTVIATAIGLCVASAMVASADTLILKNGTRVPGKVVSVAARTITFEDASGVSRRYNAAQVDAIEFATPTPRTAVVGTTGSSRRIEVVPSGTESAETLLTFRLDKAASLQAER